MAVKVSSKLYRSPFSRYFKSDALLLSRDSSTVAIIFAVVVGCSIIVVFVLTKMKLARHYFISNLGGTNRFCALYFAPVVHFWMTDIEIFVKKLIDCAVENNFDVANKKRLLIRAISEIFFFDQKFHIFEKNRVIQQIKLG